MKQRGSRSKSRSTDTGGSGWLRKWPSETSRRPDVEGRSLVHVIPRTGNWEDMLAGPCLSPAATCPLARFHAWHDTVTVTSGTKDTAVFRVYVNLGRSSWFPSSSYCSNLSCCLGLSVAWHVVSSFKQSWSHCSIWALSPQHHQGKSCPDIVPTT
jgi:hypothetical protein